MCTAAGQKAASVELLDKANDKMNMQIGGVEWIAYLFFFGYFHDAPPCFMATLFFNRSPACGILLLFYQNRVSGRCRRSFGRGVAGAGGRTFLALSVGADGEGAGCFYDRECPVAGCRAFFLLPSRPVRRIVPLLGCAGKCVPMVRSL